MALTDPEIVARGYDLPVGTDWVRDGDNNISKNARTTANALHDIEENLLGDAGASRARGTLPDGTDLNAVRGLEWVGYWHLNNGFTYHNLPAEMSGAAWSFSYEYTGSLFSDVQRVITTYEEYRREGGSAASGFNSWQRNLTESDLLTTLRGRGVLEDGTDLDTLINRAHAGVYSLSSALSYQNLPAEITQGAVLEVVHAATTTGAAVVQRVTHGGAASEQFFYWRESISGSSGWGPWNRVAQGAGDLDGVISSPSVKRIIVSADPQAPLEEGDLLFVPGA